MTHPLVHVKHNHNSRDGWHPMTAQLINIKAAETTQLWHCSKKLDAIFSLLIKSKHRDPIIYISNIDISKKISVLKLYSV